MQVYFSLSTDLSKTHTLFPYLVIESYTLMTMWVPVPSEAASFIYFGYIPRKRLLGHVILKHLISGGVSILFYIVAVLIHLSINNTLQYSLSTFEMAILFDRCRRVCTFTCFHTLTNPLCLVLSLLQCICHDDDSNRKRSGVTRVPAVVGMFAGFGLNGMFSPALQVLI